MSYTCEEVAHRWAHNKMSARTGEVRGSNTHANEVSFYSYSTIIAQYVDRKKGVVIFDESNFSHTTNRHQWAIRSALPKSVHVISLGEADILGWCHRNWDAETRMRVVNIIISRIYAAFKPYVTSKNYHFNPYRSSQFSYDSSYLSNVPAIDKLNELYGDCSLKKWLRHNYGKLGKNTKKSDQYKKRLLVQALIDKKNYSEIVDILFGEGTWESYQKRNKAIDKAKDTMAKTTMFMTEYMGFDFEPFGGSNRHRYWGGTYIKSPWTVKQLRKMTASERIDIRAQVKENRRLCISGSDIFGVEERKKAAWERAMKYLGITTWTPYWYKNEGEHDRFIIDSMVLDSEMIFKRTMYDRVVKENGSTGSYISYPSNLRREFDIGQDSELYKMFCAYPDKAVFRKRLKTTLELYQRRVKGYWLKECIKENPDLQLSGDDNHILNEIIIRMEHWAAEEAERRRVETERRMEEERQRKERERQKQLEFIEAMDEYKNGGLDGIRELYWHKDHQLPYEIRYSPDINFGGNVLLRFAHQEGYVETSKGIRLSFEECHRYWNTIKRWHDTGKFEENVTMAGYRVNSFENDILVAGCHEIAYCEMERMYAAMCEKEAA